MPEGEKANVQLIGKKGDWKHTEVVVFGGNTYLTNQKKGTYRKDRIYLRGTNTKNNGSKKEKFTEKKQQKKRE